MKTASGKRGEGIIRKLQRIAENCSDTERKADEAEKSLVEAASLRYLDNIFRENKGKIFKGLITEVNSIGMTVYLDDFLFEGVIKLSSLVSDYFRINRRRRSLEGIRTRKTYAVGQEIAVRIKRVDLIARELELMPVKP